MIKANLQLILHAEARNKKKSTVVDIERVSKLHLDEVLKITEKIKKIHVPLCESKSTADDYKTALSDIRSQTISFIRALEIVVQDLKVTADRNAAKTSVADLFLPQHSSYRINLDDEVIVLRNLTETTSMDSSQFSMKEFLAWIDRKFKSFIGTHGKPGSTRIFERLHEVVPCHRQLKNTRMGPPSTRSNTSRGSGKRQVSSDPETQSI